MKKLRASGHALKIEYSGETGVERSSTGFCRCGWMESASVQREVRNEYYWHLKRVLKRREEGKKDEDFSHKLHWGPWEHRTT